MFEINVRLIQKLKMVQNSAAGLIINRYFVPPTDSDSRSQGLFLMKIYHRIAW